MEADVVCHKLACSRLSDSGEVSSVLFSPVCAFSIQRTRLSRSQEQVSHKSNVKHALLLKSVKRMLYLGYVLLSYVLIYNLEISFNFHLTFLQLNVIKCLLCSKNCSFLTPGHFLPSPNNSNLFRFPLKARVIESRL